MKYYSYFSQETDFNISCKLSPIETICMKYQNMFSGKYKINFTNVSSAELTKRVVKVNYYIIMFGLHESLSRFKLFI